MTAEPPDDMSRLSTWSTTPSSPIYRLLTPVPVAVGISQPPVRNKMAVISLVLAVVSLLLNVVVIVFDRIATVPSLYMTWYGQLTPSSSLVYLYLQLVQSIFAVLAALLGIFSLLQITRPGAFQRGKAQAVIGIILGGLALVFIPITWFIELWFSL
jgi:hypothetical protein